MSELEHVWDLSSLCKSEKHAREMLDSISELVLNFEKTYQGNLGKKLEFFPEPLEEYENLLERISRVLGYAFLCFARDSSLGGFYSEIQLRANEIQEHLLFLELEFCDLSKEEQERILELSPRYKYYLDQILKKSKHQLELEQERILLKVSPLGIEAFSRLFDEFFSNLQINFMGEKKGEEQILALLHSGDREVRKKAQIAFTRALQKHQALLTYILNMVKKDLQITQQLRKYEKKESFRHLSNDISQKSVDSLLNTVNHHFDLVCGYYKIKSRILGHPLADYDRYAPLSFQATLGSKRSLENISYKDALDRVLECFKDFDEEFFSIAKRAIQNHWVDSHPREGKRGGAFSFQGTPNSHPYVLLNYTGNRRDIFTIAHEFGHMIHQELSKTQGYLNQDTPLTTAETASVFAEMLLFESLKKDLPSHELQEIYASKLEDIFSTLFRQVVMTNFERRIHEENVEFSTQKFSQIWLEENSRMFGDSLRLTSNYGLWWSYIPHFVHSPFYCYAYSYGQLLVLALFGIYRNSNAQEKVEFKRKYLRFLSKGGSKSPSDLIKDFGFDVEDEGFWEIGINEVKGMLREFEDLL